MITKRAFVKLSREVHGEEPARPGPGVRSKEKTTEHHQRTFAALPRSRAAAYCFCCRRQGMRPPIMNEVSLNAGIVWLS
jgi:hypothetical protein